MPRCKFCNQLNSVADSFQDPEYKSNQYCSEEHWQLYLDSKKQKQVSPTKKTKTEKPKSDRIKLTDYIKSIWPIEPNWQWLGKQIENLSKETGLSYNDMRMILKYCVEYKDMTPDGSYGLQQFIPRYSQEAKDFGESILHIRSTIGETDFEDSWQKVPLGKRQRVRRLKEDVGFE